MASFDLYKLLNDNSYPGRGIVAGLSADGRRALTAYFIMGRSENSRNRVFIAEGEELRTAAADEALLTDPSLIIYYPVRVQAGKLIVTNGDQTDTVRDYLLRGESFEDALYTRCFEPDAPNFTPRISAQLSFDGAYSYKMSILKSADASGTSCSRYFFGYEPRAGAGHFIHTYRCDGSPIPSFEGEPEEVSLPDTADEMVQRMWEALDPANKVSLFVRSIELNGGKTETRIINKNKRVQK